VAWKPAAVKIRKTWIAQNVDSGEELVLSQENALTFTKIRQIQETKISKTSAHKIKAAVLQTLYFE